MLPLSRLRKRMRGELSCGRINERMSPREIGELYTAVYALCCISGEARDYQAVVYDEFLEEIDYLLDILPTLVVPLSEAITTTTGDDLRELDEKLAKMKLMFRSGLAKIFTVFRYLERFHIPKSSKPRFKELREIKFSHMVFSNQHLHQVVEAWVVAISNGYKNKVNVELPAGLCSELQVLEDSNPQAAKNIKLGVQLAAKKWEIVKALYYALAMDVIRLICKTVS